MQPPPPLARILRSTLNLVEYYAGPSEKDGLIGELKNALRRNIVALDLKESIARSPKKNAASTRES